MEYPGLKSVDSNPSGLKEERGVVNVWGSIACHYVHPDVVGVL